MADRHELRAYTSAYAKINLDLRVIAREDTGFHQIETIFQRITLADRVSVNVRPGAGVSLLCNRDVGKQSHSCACPYSFRACEYS